MGHHYLPAALAAAAAIACVIASGSASAPAEASDRDHRRGRKGGSVRQLDMVVDFTAFHDDMQSVSLDIRRTARRPLPLGSVRHDSPLMLRQGQEGMMTRLSRLVPILLALASASAFPETYPNRPIRVIVPGAAGGVLDGNTRRVADKFSQAVGQPVVVENRPGASGNLGAEAAAKARPDGYTLFVGSSSILCVNPVVFPKLSYNPAEDFVPITLSAKGSPLLLVNPQFPASTLAEFIAYAKAHPGQVTFGTPGVGTPQHLAGEQLMKLAGVQLTHVPYKNQPQILTDLIAGQIQATIEFASIAVPHVKAGKLRALVVVGPRRKPSIPLVPTAAEAGLPAFTQTAWNGYFAPKGTPPEIVARLQQELVPVIKGKEFSEFQVSLGSEAVGSTAAEFAAFIKDECPKWRKIATEANIQLE